MSSTKSSSDNLLTRRTDDPDNSMNDAEELDQEVVPVKKGRCLSMEYSKVETLPDFPAAKKYILDTLPNYKFRYNRETEDGRKAYYYIQVKP